MMAVELISCKYAFYPATLRFASVLLLSDNRCISDFANAPSKFLTPLGTSDMLQMLCESVVLMRA